MIEIFDIAWWQIFLAGVSTLAIYSFLYKENPLYRVFEHLYIGIATGYGIVTTIRNFFWPKVLKPLLDLDRIQFPDGTYTEPYNEYNLLFLLPIAFGSLYYFILSRRFSWLAQVVIGFSLGVGSGITFQGVFNEMLPQLYDSFRPLYVPGEIRETISNIIFIFTLMVSMSYFFFTFKRRRGGVVERASSAGRWVMMGCFGAFFGATIMARMALLVERLEFLLNDWICNLAPVMQHCQV